MRLKTLRHNYTIYVNLPVEFCRKHNIEGCEGEYLDIVPHRIVRNDLQEEDLAEIVIQKVYK